MTKIVFSSDHLPPEVPAARRFGLWQELFRANVAESDFRMSEAPFQASLEFAPLGDVSLGRMSGSFAHMVAPKASASSRASERLGLVISAGNGPIHVQHRGREAILHPGTALLVSQAEAGKFTSNEPTNGWFILDLPRAALLRAAGNAENLVGTTLATSSEALRLIHGYANLVIQSGAADPLLGAHIAQSFTDLAVLALGAEKDAAEIAAQRGLKAVRLEAILRRIAAGFTDPEFSVAAVAAGLKLSVRYVQDVLHASGTGFTERVLELRLHYSCELLARAATTHRKVSDIAYSSGFSDLSYFHRCFRRCFGMTPAGAARTDR